MSGPASEFSGRQEASAELARLAEQLVDLATAEIEHGLANADQSGRRQAGLSAALQLVMKSGEKRIAADTMTVEDFLHAVGTAIAVLVHSYPRHVRAAALLSINNGLSGALAMLSQAEQAPPPKAQRH